MSKIKDFLKDLVNSLFEEDDADKIVSPTYSADEVKAGIIHLRNTLQKSDRYRDKDDYDIAFQRIHLQPQMDFEDIKEQMNTVLDTLVQLELITSEEYNRVSRDQLLQTMTDNVIQNIETTELDEIALNSLRFEQDLRRPHLEIVHKSSMDNE